ncbi:DUF397 domain-containing protein [Streptomyces sp. GXMU-J15]|uniref:DUF397 domain-containing protein n=1 Tax=Streptomyces fuscus TaxID=3048495 RepID=A0ABT7JBQ5_9ACTN|nr:DUF397 domain-containing protein [Streptomyces fuscus]MDL2081762.1 DUF397 domain-containing protein [Streptomyces fuscus]
MPPITSLTWVKSSYSSNDGPDCVEVAISPTTPLKWVKSTHSSNDGPECVEVAISPTATPTIHIRDSKHQDGPRLTVTPTAWTAFLNSRPA